MRAFIAVPVPALAKLIEASDFLKEFDVKIVDPEKLHVNISFLGDIDERRKIEVLEAMEKVKDFGSFTVPIKEISAFPSKEHINVIWASAKSEELKNIANTINSELHPQSLKNAKPFIPHITLARVKKRVSPEIKKVFEMRNFGSFDVDRVILYKSTLTPKGPIHNEISSVEL